MTTRLQKVKNGIALGGLFLLGACAGDPCQVNLGVVGFPDMSCVRNRGLVQIFQTAGQTGDRLAQGAALNRLGQDDPRLADALRREAEAGLEQAQRTPAVPQGNWLVVPVPGRRDQVRLVPSDGPR